MSKTSMYLDINIGSEVGKKNCLRTNVKHSGTISKHNYLSLGMVKFGYWLAIHSDLAYPYTTDIKKNNDGFVFYPPITGFSKTDTAFFFFFSPFHPIFFLKSGILY